MLIVVTEKSDKIYARSQSNEDICEIKSEPKELNVMNEMNEHDFMSEQIETISN